MSNLETAITELERQLALKKAYQGVKIVVPKSTPGDVAAEVQQKLLEFACGLAMDQDKAPPAPVSSDFSSEQVEALKMLADSVIAKANGSPAPASSGPTEPQKVPGTSIHKPTSGGRSRKAKIVTAENVRGEARKFCAPDDEIFVANSEKVDDHGMVSATHMRKGMMMKIPVDDLEYLD